jgi:preprotein translocase subunit YajC
MLGQHIELAAAAASKSSFNPTSLILILVVIVGVYMLMIRPQRRRQQQAQQQKNTVVPGARVRTTAGMYATVVDVDGDDVVLEVAPGVEVRYMRRAIMDVVSPGDETPTDFHGASEDESDESDEAEETGESADADAVHSDTGETDSDEDETYRTATGSTTKND